MTDEQVVELMKDPLIITGEIVQKLRDELSNPAPVFLGDLSAKYQRLRIVAELKSKLKAIMGTLAEFDKAPPVPQLTTVRVGIRAEYEGKKSLLEELIHLLEV